MWFRISRFSSAHSPLDSRTMCCKRSSWINPRMKRRLESSLDRRNYTIRRRKSMRSSHSQSLNYLENTISISSSQRISNSSSQLPPELSLETLTSTLNDYKYSTNSHWMLNAKYIYVSWFLRSFNNIHFIQFSYKFIERTTQNKYACWKIVK